MRYGKLYGVGAGPGASDLLTLRALSVLERVPVLALPRSSDFGASRAWEIVEPWFRDAAAKQKERLFLTFPMSYDAERVRSAWETALAALGERLSRGLDVAFVTEGDPSVYSTFVYVQREAPRRWPGIEIEVVPGVSSIVAVPAVTGIPLADGKERIAIVPCAYGVEDLTALLRSFDTIVLMKLGAETPRVIEALEREGLLDRAVYVARATMRDQRIVRDIRKVRSERGDCFSMIVVARRERSGVLFGDAGGERRRSEG